jgi:hypothetical protein
MVKLIMLEDMPEGVTGETQMLRPDNLPTAVSKASETLQLGQIDAIREAVAERFSDLESDPDNIVRITSEVTGIFGPTKVPILRRIPFLNAGPLLARREIENKTSVYKFYLEKGEIVVFSEETEDYDGEPRLMRSNISRVSEKRSTEYDILDDPLGQVERGNLQALLSEIGVNVELT